MQVLYLSQLVPYPADAGPKVRSYHVLQHLAAAGHQITLLVFKREEDSPEALAHLQQLCAAVHVVPLSRSRLRDAAHLVGALLTGQPFLIRRDGVRAMYEAVREVVRAQSFDVVHADQLWMAQYALAAKAERGNRTKTEFVLDQHNAMYLIPERLAAGNDSRAQRLLLGVESRNMSRYEVRTCSQFDHVVWVTEDDRRAVEKVAGANGKGWHAAGAPRHSVIPICVDPQAKKVIARRGERRRVTFLGGLHWPPNAEGVEWFVKEVWPLVARQVPDAVFTVIGKNPPAVLREGPVQGRGQVEVTGYVEDPKPYLEETAAFIVPLHAGGGMRVKIIDAWSWGLPVVSTTIGAEGISYENGTNILIADDASAFAAAVLELLQRESVAEQLGAAGRRTLESLYDWRAIYCAWDDVYHHRTGEDRAQQQS